MKPDANQSSPTGPEAIELPDTPLQLPEIELPDDSVVPSDSRAESGTWDAPERSAPTGAGDRWFPNDPQPKTRGSGSHLPESPSGDLLKALHEVGFEIATCHNPDSQETSCQ